MTKKNDKELLHSYLDKFEAGVKRNKGILKELEGKNDAKSQMIRGLAKSNLARYTSLRERAIDIGLRHKVL